MDKYEIKKASLLYSVKRFAECLEICRNLLKKYLDSNDNLAILNLFILITRVIFIISTSAIIAFLFEQSQLELSQLWEGYSDYLKAQSIIADIQTEENLNLQKKYAKLSFDDLSSWNDSDIDTLIKTLDDIGLHYLIKLSKDSYTTNTVYVTGMNMSSGLLGLGKNDPSKIHNKASIKLLPEFKNRKILQVACGDHHTLVLVQGSIFNLYDVSKVLTRVI